MKNNTSTKNKEILFFAYQGMKTGCADDNVEAIKKAILDYNTYQHTIEAFPWENLTSSGGFISEEILEKIKAASSFACDLTRLNHNVLFELGYACAKNKNIFIFLNENIENAKINYSNFLLKNMRYSPFKNAKDIHGKLQNKEYSHDHIKSIIPKPIFDVENDIFYLDSEAETQASLDLNEFLKSQNADNFKIKLSDPHEVEYKTLSYYFTNLQTTKSVIFHMVPENYENHNVENAKKSFLAGVALGLDKKVLLIAPAKYRSPLDYADILETYISSEDCINRVRQWLSTNCISELDTKMPEQVQDNSNFGVLQIALECVAENEKEDLLNYFVSTNAYEKAKENKSKILLVGRKGSGKTAIYFKLLDDLSKNNLNYNVSLKPESLELLESIDFSTLYKSESSKKTFFYTVWKTVIYSKLIQIIENKINTKLLNNGSNINAGDNEILEFCKSYQNYLKQNFYGVIKEINTDTHTGLNSPNILEDLYKKYITPLTNLLKAYFNDKKYITINVLADNLDKSWNPQNNLLVQSDMILTLLEVDSTIKNDLSNDRKNNIGIHGYIFLREDIYNYISKTANEPDKLRTLLYKIDWENYPLKLKELIELKLKHILNKAEDTTLDDLWMELFEKFDKKSPFDVIKNIIILRPRDILFFIQDLFVSAANNNRVKVSRADFEYAIAQYTEFLNGNLIAEMKAEFPEVVAVVNFFQKYHIVRYNDYVNKLKKLTYDENRIENLTKDLFKNGYLFAFDRTANLVCKDYDELKQLLLKRILYFWKHDVVFMVNERYLNVKRYLKKEFFS
ncbi:hypothetical protein NO2_0706 [Candidatus Termititenax persephonae]|uniref:Uncharacterized protein n=1 Tax=Candidatus Termititenax persephonae TaxID=2218525 RepID=A0A388TIC9_9BACT|nr:hypothetical protein NO2_0706 [Candidatus Termititenax persephonae]